MAERWLGSIVSVDCGDTHGIYEGKISSIDNDKQTLSLINVSRNNVKCPIKEITLSTTDILKLSLLESTVPSDQKLNASLVQNVSAFTQFPHNGCVRSSPQQDDASKKKNDGKKKQIKRHENKKWLKGKDDDCLNAPVDSEVFETEFDFEKNLALFDKQAVYEEINALSKPDHVKLIDCNKRCNAKYRHDENVLVGDVPLMRMISIPCSADKEYVTDTGLIVPSVTVEFKKRLSEEANNCGLTNEIQLEMIGRAASEMVLQLLGGNHRINPQNTHQRPTAVVLCGSHLQGAQGMNCGRHLANHCVNVTVLTPQCLKADTVLERELRLFSLSGGKLVCSVTDLPTTVDIIIGALDSHGNIQSCDNSWWTDVKQWAKQCKAPTLSLDPPPDAPSLDQKWILSPILPFAFKNSSCSIYICDIGIPKGIFKKIESSYSSPFGSKFIIPLYMKASDVK